MRTKPVSFDSQKNRSWSLEMKKKAGTQKGGIEVPLTDNALPSSPLEEADGTEPVFAFTCQVHWHRPGATIDVRIPVCNNYADIISALTGSICVNAKLALADNPRDLVGNGDKKMTRSQWDAMLEVVAETFEDFERNFFVDE